MDHRNRRGTHLAGQGSLLPPARRRPTAAPPPSDEAFDFFLPESGLYFEIWDSELFFSDRSISLGKRSLPLPPSFPPEPSIADHRLPDGESVRLLVQEVRIPMPGARAAPARFNVAVASNRSMLDARLRSLLKKISAVLLGAIFLTILFIRLSIQKAFRPLRQLERQIETIGAASIEQRLDTNTVPKEVQPLVIRLNDLLKRLAESAERESRFTADVAHELRTPVAELTALAEVRTTWPDRASPEDDLEFLRIGRHMKLQIETLLTLARLDRGQAPIVREPIDLVALIASHWAPLANAAETRRLQVDLPQQYELPAPPVLADPDLLSIIVRNLLENAVAYTPADGQIRVRVRRSADDPNAPILQVDNKVNDPQALDTTAMFDRFWRADGARSAPGHSGLGLALCRSSALAMGWNLQAQLDPPSCQLSIRLVDNDG